MISNWQFVTVPSNVDLTKPLMPLRDTSQDSGWPGVDLAWLLEVGNTYLHAVSIYDYSMTMSESPKASEANVLNEMLAFLARIGSSFHGTARPNAIETSLSFQGLSFNQAYLPGQVSVGDALDERWFRRGYAFLSPVKGVHYLTSCSLAKGSAGTGTAGGSSAYVPTLFAFDVYQYYFAYVKPRPSMPDQTSHAGWADATGATAVTLSPQNLGNVDAACFSSVDVFLQIKVNDNGVNSSRWIRVPKSAASSIVLSASEVAGAINAALGDIGVSKRTGLMGTTSSYYMSISLGTSAYVVCQFASDYVVPTAA